MIYIEERSFENQIALLKLFVESSYYIVFWIYPESKIQDFLGHQLYERDNFTESTATTYKNAVTIRRTEYFKFSKHWIDLMSKKKNS